jgi:maleylpyruvate isomerase
VNPQGLVPALELDDASILTQSLAICEYLDEIHAEPPLLPSDPLQRARVRAFAQVIACDIHPVQNLRVLSALRAGGFSDAQVSGWTDWVIKDGLEACAKLIDGEPGPFCFGDKPSLADICLVPQLANARRFKVEVNAARLLEVDAACAELDAFKAAAPDRQEDANDP